MDREGGSNGSSYYSVLGIRQDASFSDVRSAYRKLALKWHPDRCTKNPAVTGEANHRFQKIQEAYSVLSDESKRSMYDAGVLDLFDEDEGMGDFMHDLMKMMDNNKVSAEVSRRVWRICRGVSWRRSVQILPATTGVNIRRPRRGHVTVRLVTSQRSALLATGVSGLRSRGLHLCTCCLKLN